MAPQGTTIAVTCGAHYNDHDLVCEKLKAILNARSLDFSLCTRGGRAFDDVPCLQSASTSAQ